MSTTAQEVRARRQAKFKTRQFNRCELCGRARGYYRKFHICRMCFRQLAHEGKIPGCRKASW